MNTKTLPQSETVEPEVINTPKDFFIFFTEQSASFIITVLQRERRKLFSSH